MDPIGDAQGRFTIASDARGGKGAGMIVVVEGFRETLVLDASVDGDVDRFAAYLMSRHSGRNCFWIRRPDEKYPCLAVAFSGGFAMVNFFDAEHVERRNWISESDIPDLPHGGETVFCLVSEGEEQSMGNGVVIRATDAVSAAMAFIRDPLHRPSCIAWLEL